MVAFYSSLVVLEFLTHAQWCAWLLLRLPDHDIIRTHVNTFALTYGVSTVCVDLSLTKSSEIGACKQTWFLFDRLSSNWGDTLFWLMIPRAKLELGFKTGQQTFTTKQCLAGNHPGTFFIAGLTQRNLSSCYRTRNGKDGSHASTTFALLFLFFQNFPR